MDLIVVLAALLSAFLHAAWNAAVKAAPDSDGAMAAQVVASGLIALPLLAFFPLPPLAAIPWLTASTACNVLSMVLLLRGYEHGGFGFVYPLARAASPLLVTLLAGAVVGERLSPVGLAGIALVSTGVALFAIGPGQHGPRAIVYALAAGACTAAYIVCDAQGARLSPSVPGYALVVATVNAAAFGTLHGLRRGSVAHALRVHWGLATFGSAAAIASYMLILWVWSRAPIAVGAALRDTSIVFGALIAVAVLKERLGFRRLAAVGVIACGVAALRFA
ncbi:MAG TPA: EamA family transporter [Microvirga sp.]|jgi:drug/metabolite transporter (DMT)-like permease